MRGCLLMGATVLVLPWVGLVADGLLGATRFATFVHFGLCAGGAIDPDDADALGIGGQV
ncbi:MAG: hypothetical protein H6734_07100 [Alphaproteobacteria bacterium]|nr:hypothetical protein [Alphaproteobacteria bacterium]